MPFEQNENYVLPPLQSKQQVLGVIHQLTEAGIRGVIAPRTLTSVLYALQVALSVFNSNMPDKPQPQLATGVQHIAATIEGEKLSAKNSPQKRKKK